MSYHRGSVWPHDNSLIAFGMARYGYKQEASAIFSALFETSLHFREYRLPELFCGNQRHHRDEPVQYPVSCSPQAWASGTPIVILTALLGLKPDASSGELRIVNPRLPEFLTFLESETCASARAGSIWTFFAKATEPFAGWWDRGAKNLPSTSPIGEKSACRKPDLTGTAVRERSRVQRR